MNYWIWSTIKENWSIVKRDHIWAVKYARQASRIKENDIIIFYINRTSLFGGIFKVIGAWHNNESLVWDEEYIKNVKIYAWECNLESIIISPACIQNLKLNITKNMHYGRVMKGHINGPSNFGKPIPEKDYKTIYKKMIVTKNI